MSAFSGILFSSSTGSLPDRTERKIHIICKWQDLELCDGALFFHVSTFPFSCMLWDLIYQRDAPMSAEPGPPGDGRGRRDLPQSLQRKHSPAHTLVLDFGP